MNVYCQDVKRKKDVKRLGVQFIFKDEVKLFFLVSRRNALKHKVLLTNQKLYFRQIAEKNIIFRRNNAPIYAARIIKLWLEKNSILNSDWFANLNIIENV